MDFEDFRLRLLGLQAGGEFSSEIVAAGCIWMLFCACMMAGDACMTVGVVQLVVAWATVLLSLGGDCRGEQGEILSPAFEASNPLPVAVEDKNPRAMRIGLWIILDQKKGRIEVVVVLLLACLFFLCQAMVMVSSGMQAVTAASASATTCALSDRKVGNASDVFIRLWPPGPRTRAHIVERMAENLKSLSSFYSPVDADEAARLALQIEELALEEGQHEVQTTAIGVCSNNGSSAVRVYAKHASKVMLEVLKTGKLPEQAKVHEPILQSDISGEKRDVLGMEKAEELFQALTTSTSVHTKIRLSNWSFKRVLSGIQDRLIKADLSNIPGGFSH